MYRRPPSGAGPRLALFPQLRFVDGKFCCCVSFCEKLAGRHRGIYSHPTLSPGLLPLMRTLLICVAAVFCVAMPRYERQALSSLTSDIVYPIHSYRDTRLATAPVVCLSLFWVGRCTRGIFLSLFLFNGIRYFLSLVFTKLCVFPVFSF